MALTVIKPSGINTTGNYVVTGISVSANLVNSGNVNFANATNVSLGPIGNVKITGGTSGQYLTTDGSGNLSFSTINISSASISNGNSNVNVSSANGNVTISAAGNANIATITGSGINVAGYLTATGDITANNFIGNGSQLTGIASAANATNANVANIANTANVANIANVANSVNIANVVGIGNIANINLDGNASNILYGNGVFATQPTSYSNTNAVSLLSSFGSNTITTTGNVSVGNIIGNGQALTGLTGANVTGQVGNALVAGTVYTNAQPNITSVGTLGNLTSNGTINFTGASNVSLGAIGNVKITGGSNGQYLTTDGSGNLSFATVSGGAGASISNGNSNVNVTSANGNVTVSVSGNSNVVTITSTGVNVAGTGNFTGDLVAANFISGTGNGGSITGANLISANFFTGTLTTSAQPNITSVGTLGNLTSNGTINFTSASNVSLGAVGNVKITGGTSGQYLTTDGSGNLSFATVSVTSASISNGNSNVNIPSANGNVTVSAAGNANIAVITGTGVNVAGTLNATGNANVGNLGATRVIANLFTGTLVTANQPNITIVGNLSNLVVTGTTSGGVNALTTETIAANGILSSRFSPAVLPVSINNGTGQLTELSFTSTGLNGPKTTVIDPSGRFVYICNRSGNTISQFSINDATGALTSIATPIAMDASAPQPTSLDVDPFGKNLYVVSSTNSVQQFSIDQTTGALTSQSIITGSFTGVEIRVHPTGKFVYTFGVNVSTSAAIITIYTVNSTTGALTQLGTFDPSVASLNGGVIDPSGRFLYVAGSSSIRAVSINQSSGQLTLGSSIVVSGSGPYGCAIDPSGELLFVYLYSGGSIQSYSIDYLNGSLTAIGSGTATGGLTSSTGSIRPITVDPTGRYLYFADNTSNTIPVFSIAQPSGVLTRIGTNVSVTSGPEGVAVTPNGKYLICSAGGTARAYTFGIQSFSSYNVTANTGNFATITANTAAFTVAQGTAPFTVNSNTQIANLNAATAGRVTTASQPNITSVGTLTGLTSNGTINFTGASNVSLGAVGNVKITGGNANFVLSTDGTGNLSWVAQSGGSAPSNISNGTSNVSIASSNGNVTISAAGNANIAVITGTGVNIAGTLNATGNITGVNANLGNLVTANFFSGSGNLLSNIQGSNVTGAVGSATTAGTVTTASQPNITSVGTLTDLSVSGNTVVGGDLIVNGVTTYINVTRTAVRDPIIELGGGSNGVSLASNDAKDRGTLLRYYTTAPVDAFMGWDISNSEFAFGSNVSLFNEVVTVNEFGNVRANYFFGNGSQLTGISATSSNTANSANTANIANVANIANIANSVAGANVTGTVANANYAAFAGNITIASQPNITSLGTLSSLSVNGAANLGNVANVKILGGNANFVLSTDGAGNLSWVAQTGGNGGGNGTTLANLVVDSFTGDNTTTQFTLSVTPANINLTSVNYDGVVLLKTDYTLSGANITLSQAPATNSKIEVTTTQLGSGSGGSSSSTLAWTIANSNITLASTNAYFVDTSSGPLTLTLPATPSLGDTIKLNDLAGTFATNNLTVARNGKLIQGLSQNLVLDYNNTTVEIIFSNNTYGWKVMGL